MKLPCKELLSERWDDCQWLQQNRKLDSTPSKSFQSRYNLLLSSKNKNGSFYISLLSHLHTYLHFCCWCIIFLRKALGNPNTHLFRKLIWHRNDFYVIVYTLVLLFSVQLGTIFSISVLKDYINIMVIKWLRAIFSSSKKLIGTDDLGNKYFEEVRGNVCFLFFLPRVCVCFSWHETAMGFLKRVFKKFLCILWIPEKSCHSFYRKDWHSLLLLKQSYFDCVFTSNYSFIRLFGLWKFKCLLFLASGKIQRSIQNDMKPEDYSAGHIPLQWEGNMFSCGKMLVSTNGRT